MQSTKSVLGTLLSSAQLNSLIYTAIISVQFTFHILPLNCLCMYQQRSQQIHCEALNCHSNSLHWNQPMLNRFANIKLQTILPTKQFVCQYFLFSLCYSPWSVVCIQYLQWVWFKWKLRVSVTSDRLPRNSATQYNATENRTTSIARYKIGEWHSVLPMCCSVLLCFLCFVLWVRKLWHFVIREIKNFRKKINFILVIDFTVAAFHHIITNKHIRWQQRKKIVKMVYIYCDQKLVFFKIFGKFQSIFQNRILP